MSGIAEAAFTNWQWPLVRILLQCLGGGNIQYYIGTVRVLRSTNHIENPSVCSVIEPCISSRRYFMPIDVPHVLPRPNAIDQKYSPHLLYTSSTSPHSKPTVIFLDHSWLQTVTQSAAYSWSFLSVITWGHYLRRQNAPPPDNRHDACHSCLLNCSQKAPFYPFNHKPMTGYPLTLPASSLLCIMTSFRLLIIHIQPGTDRAVG